MLKGKKKKKKIIEGFTLQLNEAQQKFLYKFLVKNKVV